MKAMVHDSPGHRPVNAAIDDGAPTGPRLWRLAEILTCGAVPSTTGRKS